MATRDLWFCLMVPCALVSFGFGLMPEEAIGTWDNFLAGFFIGLMWMCFAIAVCKGQRHTS